MDLDRIYELFGKELNPQQFAWNRWCGQMGVSVLTIFDSDGDNVLNPRFICEGWIDASKLVVRPKTQGIAILLLDTEYDEIVWCHVSKEYLHTLILKFDLKNK